MCVCTTYTYNVLAQLILTPLYLFCMYVFVILELGIRSIKDDKIVRSHLHVSSESSRRKKTQVCMY